ncbi:unnamed protein product [Callosobruchus maculatus]|uniref:C2H2-type domain-containing protein n=1 Tax=Callosobruchus maculatus TaxID=64391 RepID=A0A653DL16_CALMS|nr:unnamed protein product [Callosobruchus maculatus]
MHSLTEPFKCENCGRCYGWKRGLQAHQRYQCGVKRQFFCPVERCGYKAPFKFTVRRLINNIHPAIAGSIKYLPQRVHRMWETLYDEIRTDEAPEVRMRQRQALPVHLL